jgi:hypothetical protein
VHNLHHCSLTRTLVTCDAVEQGGIGTHSPRSVYWTPSGMRTQRPRVHMAPRLSMLRVQTRPRNRYRPAATSRQPNSASEVMVTIRQNRAIDMFHFPGFVRRAQPPSATLSSSGISEMSAMCSQAGSWARDLEPTDSAARRARPERPSRPPRLWSADRNPACPPPEMPARPPALFPRHWVPFHGHTLGQTGVWAPSAPSVSLGCLP